MQAEEVQAEESQKKRGKRARSASRPGPRERAAAAAQQSEATEEPAAVPASSKRAKPAVAAATPSPPAHEVFVANLPFDVTEERLRELFASCGEAGPIRWLEHKDSGKFKGSVFLSFASKEAAAAAVALNGTDADGRALRVDFAAGGSAAVYVGNLPKEVDNEMLKGAFAECGTVMAVWGSKKGKRYVKFSSAAAAQAALAKDGSEFGGRPMRVLLWQQPAL